MPCSPESDLTTHGAPVYTLPHDLLSYIFEINANIFLDCETLETTLRTSQVCGTWRECMLATPSLWGRLIDFDYFCDRSTVVWGRELLRRSNSSMLWIKAEDFPSSDAWKKKNLLPFFNELLQTQRHRIQRLVANITQDHWISQGMIDPLFLPWPCLEELRVLDEGGEHPIGPLFANQAPALRQLEARAHRFDPTAPWIRSLCSLHIWSQFTVLELLSALSLTTNLEDLHVGNIQEEVIPLTPRLHSVQLPRLRGLVFAGHFNATLTLLHHLNISASCTLNCCLYMESRNSAECSTNSGLLRALFQHARRYFQAHAPETIRLLYSGHSIYLDIYTRGDGTKFTVNISQRGKALPQDIVAPFLTELTLPQLGQATELCLQLNPQLPLAVLVPFFASLERIEVIQITSRSFIFLSDTQEAPGALGWSGAGLFPALHTLKTDCRQSSDVSSDVENVRRFASARHTSGRPLILIDMFTAPILPASLALFEHMPGLKIRWSKGFSDDPNRTVWEYVCGSGTLEGGLIAA